MRLIVFLNGSCDFRPDYKKLNVVIENIGSPTVLALTATATKEVLQDIADSLNLKGAAEHVILILTVLILQ